jgi:16S rRNA (uracil1498-N3)-methyltransferase
MHHFYCPHILSSLQLTEEESVHAIRVLRLGIGDTIRIFDGNGHIYNAVIEQAHPKHTSVRISDTLLVPKNRNYRIHIAIAPTKNLDRIEWFVEKVCEMGVDRITPLICRYSERKICKTDRLHKIMVAAIKQSQQAYMPVLDDAMDFSEWLSSSESEQKFIAHCYDDNTKKELANAYISGKDVVVGIGPEGDFSEEELKKAFEKGFKSVSLGETRLRTETAGIVACHTIHVVNQLIKR